MAQQSIVGGLTIPQFVLLSGAPSYSSALLMDASTEKVAFAFSVPETGTLDTAEFRTGAVSINASSVVRVSFQDIALATGDPDGTQDQYRDISGAAISSNSWIQPGLMTSDGTDTGAKRSVTRGDLLAVVMEYQTFTAADSVIVSQYSTTGAGLPGNHYCNLYTGSWAKQGSTSPILSLKYNDGTYRCIPGLVLPFKAINTTTFNNTSTPDERGLKFSMPWPCVLRGAVVSMALSGAGGASVKLYDSDGSTVLATVALDADVKRSTGGLQYYVQFANVTLAANTSYRITVLPDSATNISTYDADVHSAAHLDGLSGGQNWHYTQRTDAGAWTDTTTKRPFLALVVDSVDDAAGGSCGTLLLLGVGATKLLTEIPHIEQGRRSFLKSLSSVLTLPLFGKR